MNRHVSLSIFVALCVLAIPAAAVETASLETSRCEVVDRSSTTVLLFCAGNLSADALREAGSSVCMMRNQCNAWIWADRQRVPSKAPAAQEHLPESARASASAIWINESQSLIILRRQSR